MANEPQEYDEVSVVVDGVLEQVVCFDASQRVIASDYGMTQADGTQWTDFLDGIEATASQSGLRYEVFILSHGHPMDIGDEECACAQYVTDHNPNYVFNDDDDS
jgi:hypothetical protein